MERALAQLPAIVKMANRKLNRHSTADTRTNLSDFLFCTHKTNVFKAAAEKHNTKTISAALGPDDAANFQGIINTAEPTAEMNAKMIPRPSDLSFICDKPTLKTSLAHL